MDRLIVYFPEGYSFLWEAMSWFPHVYFIAQRLVRGARNCITVLCLHNYCIAPIQPISAMAAYILTGSRPLFAR